MNLNGINGYIFYGLTGMLMIRNVNNDVTMNPPILIVFSHDVTATILVSQNNKTGAILPSPAGVLPYMGYIGTCRGIGYGF